MCADWLKNYYAKDKYLIMTRRWWGDTASHK